MNLPQRVALNTAAQLVGRVVSIGLWLVSFALVTRYLGVGGFGEYSLVLAFVALLVPIADAGLTLTAVREVRARPEREDEILADAFGLRIFLAAAAAVILVAISPLFPYSDRVETGLRIAAIGLFFLVLSGVPTMVFQSRIRLDLAALVDLVTAASTLILIVIVTQADLGFTALISASVAAAVLTASTSFLLASRYARLRPAFDRRRMLALLLATLPVGLFTTLGIIHFKIDTVLLSLLQSVDDVGIYSVAYRFLEQALLFPALFMASVYPILASLIATRDEGLQLAFDKSLMFLLSTAIPLAAGTFILAPDIVSLVAGDDFDEAVTPMRVLVFASLFIFTNALFASLLILYRRQRQLVLLVGGGLTLNIVLNLILIPLFSYQGAAAATVVTEGTVGIAMIASVLRYSGLALHLAALPRIALATTGMCLVLWMSSPLPFGVTILLGLVTYGVLGYVLGVVTRADIDLILARRPAFSEPPPL